MATVRAIFVMDDSIGCWRVKFPFNRSCIEEIKSTVAAAGRSYDKATSQWIIDDFFLPDVQKIMDKFFGGGVAGAGWTIHKPVATTGISNDTSKHYRVFCKLVPKEDLKKAYRAAMIACHPDRGGDATVSADLNVAWDQIKHELDIG